MQIPYMQKEIVKNLKWKKLGEFHDFHLKNDTSLLALVFQNFREMCLKIYHLDSEKFILAVGLTWQAALKRLKQN